MFAGSFLEEKINHEYERNFYFDKKLTVSFRMKWKLDKLCLFEIN